MKKSVEDNTHGGIMYYKKHWNTMIHYEIKKMIMN